LRRWMHRKPSVIEVVKPSSREVVGRRGSRRQRRPLTQTPRRLELGLEDSRPANQRRLRSTFPRDSRGAALGSESPQPGRFIASARRGPPRSRVVDSRGRGLYRSRDFRARSQRFSTSGRVPAKGVSLLRRRRVLRDSQYDRAKRGSPRRCRSSKSPDVGSTARMTARDRTNGTNRTNGTDGTNG
jgi:hypothetical protein